MKHTILALIPNPLPEEEGSNPLSLRERVGVRARSESKIILSEYSGFTLFF